MFGWRRVYRQSLLEGGISERHGLLPVRVVGAAAREAARSSSSLTHTTASGLIQVDLPRGQLRIPGRVDAEALRVVLEKLLG